jgi:hypothetical protein
MTGNVELSISDSVGQILIARPEMRNDPRAERV